MALFNGLLLKPASRIAYANAIGKHSVIDMEGLMEIVKVLTKHRLDGVMFEHQSKHI
jgi:hypothetical protein